MSKIFKYLSFLTIGVIIIYITPLFFNVLNWKISDVFPEVIFDTDYKSSLVRTLSFSIISTLGVVLLSFLGGYALRRSRSKKSLLLGSILLLPFLLGSVSTSFLFKILLLDSNLLGLAFSNTAVLFSVLAALQYWQFGTLFIYVFWLNNLGIREGLIDYTDYYKFTSWEKIKNVFLPYHRDLIILLSIFFFVSNIYESIKLQVIFRASKGTNSELISHTLYNAYLSDSKISPNFAANVLFSQSAMFYLPLFLLATVLLYVFLNSVILLLSKSKIYFPTISIGSDKLKNKVSGLFLMSLVTVIVLPIVLAFLLQGIKIYNLNYLLKTIRLSFVASAILLIILTLPLSYYLRVVWRNRFYKISRKNLWVFITLFLLFLIPPLALMLFGFEWSSILGVRGVFSTNVIWILGQCINSLPIIASFIFVIHFAVQNKEIDYLNIMKASFSEIINWSFIKRFRIEYLMTFLFSFSIIWNEGTFNKVYSDRIPSYVSEILRTVNSRNADYSQGMMFFLFSLLLGISCIALWNAIVYRLFKIK